MSRAGKFDTDGKIASFSARMTKKLAKLDVEHKSTMQLQHLASLAEKRAKNDLVSLLKSERGQLCLFTCAIDKALRHWTPETSFMQDSLPSTCIALATPAAAVGDSTNTPCLRPKSFDAQKKTITFDNDNVQALWETFQARFTVCEVFLTSYAPWCHPGRSDYWTVAQNLDDDARTWDAESVCVFHKEGQGHPSIWYCPTRTGLFSDFNIPKYFNWSYQSPTSAADQFCSYLLLVPKNST